MNPSVSRVALSTGLSYEVLEWAPDDAACSDTVLLLHGYLDLAWGWQPVVDAGLRGRYHVIAPSFRGHGASDWVGAGSMYYFLDYVADIASLVNQRARQRLSVVGHSMGGTVSAYFTGTYPERVSKLVLLEGLVAEESPTSPDRLRTSNGLRADVVARRGTQDAPATRRFASIAEAAARMRHHDKDLDEALALALCEKGCLQLASGEWVFRHDPLLAPSTPMGFELAIARRFWEKIACEVLYVKGERSTLLHHITEDRLAPIPRLRVTTMADVGHMMIRHEPRAVAEIVVDFLQGAP